LAATLKRELGVDSELVRGSGGIFVVSVDGAPIFSKKDQGRFPTEREIVDQLRSRV
jgi:selT/selW/selH-like putative selenoprotein